MDVVDYLLLRKGSNCFSILQMAITDISKQMLVKHWRELESDGIIERTIFPAIPPRVEYNISELGQTMFTIIDAMSEWGLGRMGDFACEQ